MIKSEVFIAYGGRRAHPMVSSNRHTPTMPMEQITAYRDNNNLLRYLSL